MHPVIWPGAPLNWGDFLQRWRQPEPGELSSMTCHARGKVDDDEAP